MKKTIAVFLGILFLAPVLSAQQGRNRRRPRYDATQEKTYPGVVVSAEMKQGKRRGHLAVIFKSRGVNYRLAIGPKGWLEGKGITLAAGTSAVVRGVAHTGRRGTFLVVRTIRSGGKKVELRDSNGHPHWPRRRRRSNGDKD